MKVCNKCGEDKKKKHFSWRNKAKGTLNCWCKPCMHKYDELRFRNMSPAKKKEKAQRQAERYLIHRQFLWDYLKENPCVSCGNPDPRVLQFDHLRDKEYTVGNMAGSNSIETLTGEIDKCQVLCANCHSIKTADQLGWYKYIPV